MNKSAVDGFVQIEILGQTRKTAVRRPLSRFERRQTTLFGRNHSTFNSIIWVSTILTLLKSSSMFMIKTTFLSPTHISEESNLIGPISTLEGSIRSIEDGLPSAIPTNKIKGLQGTSCAISQSWAHKTRLWSTIQPLSKIQYKNIYTVNNYWRYHHQPKSKIDWLLHHCLDIQSIKSDSSWSFRSKCWCIRCS